MLRRLCPGKGSFIGLMFFSFILLYTPVLFACGNSVTLSWIPPSTNINGSPLTDLNGYKLYYGNASKNYTSVINVGMDTAYKVCYLQEGRTYYFAVKAYDTHGNESLYSREVSKIIVSLPTASFTGYPTSGIAPLTVKFSNNSSGYDTPFKYAWDFDSNGIVDSTLTNPSVLYTAPGIYSVKLTATDFDSDKNTLTRTNYITVCHSLANITGKSAAYSSLQTAYNAATNMAAIQSRAASFSGGLNINRNITVTMDGGYDCLHSAQTGSTTIMGNMRISSGKVIIKSGKFVVQ